METEGPATRRVQVSEHPSIIVLAQDGSSQPSILQYKASRLKLMVYCFYRDFSTSANNTEIDKTKPLWHNYFRCGFKGIQEHFGLSNLPGMNCLVDGNIPPSSGLSSSSALVCCAGLATLTVLGMSLSKV
ncbi:hypothetical protein MC885_006024, partial [Smutsia gigantea]